MTQRSVLSEDRSVLIVAPVGGAGVKDRGSFNEAFRPRTSADLENRTTIDAKRASQLIRVTLEDLMLADEFDVVRFLVTNAAWGNSDRHSANIHYGWIDAPDSVNGGFGVLLPIDHGRCFYNNAAVEQPQSEIAGTPVEAVTGRISNPHQLLRPFSQLAIRDEAAVLDTIALWCGQLADVVARIYGDPVWTAFQPELASMRERIDQIQAERAELVKAVMGVVRW